PRHRGAVVRGDRAGARHSGRDGAVAHQPRPVDAEAQTLSAATERDCTMKCAAARRLFGAYWDDETTQAEREWLEAHFAACPGCRAEYEGLARTLEWTGSLPRIEPAADLAERTLVRARRASPATERLSAGGGPGVPATEAEAPTLLVRALVT